MTDLGLTPALPDGYAGLLNELKAAVQDARVRAARSVNREVLDLYWRIGRLILDRQHQEGWGTKVIERLSADLRAEFPGMRGFSARSLVYMRSFAAAWPDPITQEPLAQLPWSHVTTLLDVLDDQTSRDWYAARDVEHGWSAAVLAHHIRTGLRERSGAAPNNFTDTMPPGESDQTKEILRDPYDLDFLALSPGYSERDLEDALVARLTHFLGELGAGFAFVGRQHRIQVGNREYFIDLLFYHLRLRRFVVFELKTGELEPEHIGKLNFYVNAVDDQLRRTEHGDGSTIGILLVADRDDVVVEYSLRGLTTPMAISTYRSHQQLPADLQASLPTAGDLAQIVRTATHSPNEQPKA